MSYITLWLYNLEYITSMSNEDFVIWIKEELDRRGWSQNELARRSGLTSMGVSHVLTMNRNPGLEFCTSIAKALGYSDVEVLRRAGLIRAPVEEQVESMAEMTFNEIMALVKGLNLVERRELLKLVREKYGARLDTVARSNDPGVA